MSTLVQRWYLFLELCDALVILVRDTLRALHSLWASITRFNTFTDRTRRVVLAILELLGAVLIHYYVACQLAQLPAQDAKRARVGLHKTYQQYVRSDWNQETVGCGLSPEGLGREREQRFAGDKRVSKLAELRGHANVGSGRLIYESRHDCLKEPFNGESVWVRLSKL